MPKQTRVAKVQLLTHTQACLYCHQDFVPVRRGTQKHCSNSCRVSYCRKKRQGTLHRVKQLPGPARPAVPFGELYLAATAGALTANAVTQTAEYYLLTQDLLAQQRQLQQQVQQQQALSQQQQALLQQQSHLLAHLQHDQQRLLQALGVPPAPTPDPSPLAGTAAESPTRLLPDLDLTSLEWPLGENEGGPHLIGLDWLPAEDALVGVGLGAALPPPVG